MGSKALIYLLWLVTAGAFLAPLLASAETSPDPGQLMAQNGAGRELGFRPQDRGPGGPGGRTPPPEAFEACSGKAQGADCTVGGHVQGTCRRHPQGLLCVPKDHMRGGRGSPGTGPGGRQSYPRGEQATRLRVKHRIKTHGVPDTGQLNCFDGWITIPCPRPGQPYYGQDAQYAGPAMSYKNNGDGTVSGLDTGLMWQKDHNSQRLGFYQAKNYCHDLSLAGHQDWRLPGIKELFSISLWTGSTGGGYFLDSTYFDLAPPSADEMAGDPAPTHYPDMMGQTWSDTIYSGDHWGRGVEAAFFFNFLDGRIKNAPTRGPFKLFYRCARGKVWGINQFVDNGDGTITDKSVDSMWQKTDDGKKRDWLNSLAYCEGLKLGGHDDWRLPNIKELEYIVDYSRSDPALNPMFVQRDSDGWFWSSTTHGDNLGTAAYVCFGKCVSADGVDTHGAGAQRSDPKAGNPKAWPPMGGQRDQVRIYNYVRCVR
jgi:uncharacterized protein DUF1566